MKTQRIQSSEAFDATVKETVANAPGRVFILLFGTEDEKTGESWCPDCVIADPLVRKHVRQVADSTLLEVPVGARSAWRSPDNFYRSHPQLKLTAVPTLFEWGKDGPIKSLVEDDVNNVELLERFLA
ncbi:uncharacterized protein EV422DRAFT_565422 [Fimicolochytrium jonesii]|uniref:uncharacterized protein n=1 Tax=Fimicolochytrium jonesii TaxID=1396493 RepID=UPI0022FE21F2|nr:uncharacterized protein EV422DRAFT_565422 [Fimicolochytrium jonesii]KAI8823478.1 hypothetical protein EV422DRAFT_565422 [Fimicolochytrium jonesii]